jgi:hypothetical protein
MPTSSPSSPTSATERKLLKKLAAAYAFIDSLRKVAIERVDALYIKKTMGIEEAINVAEKEYPKLFKKYFKKAQSKGTKEGEKTT